jgi:hypothetical protein
MEQAKETHPIRFLVKPRPLIKWKCFWIGILVLVFLGWSWARSMKHIESVGWAAPQFGLGLSHVAGAVSFAFVDGDSSRWGKGALTTGVESRRIRPENLGDYRAIRRFSVSRNGVESSGVKLAHWFLILLFLVPWLGFLFWRVRKQKKLSP